MVQHQDSSPAVEPTPFSGRTCRLSTSLFLPGSFLDSNSVAGKSARKNACAVGPLDFAGDNRFRPPVADGIGAEGAANVPDVVGTLALPAALLPDGEVLQHAVGASAAHDLRRIQMDTAAAKSTMAPGV